MMPRAEVTATYTKDYVKPSKKDWDLIFDQVVEVTASTRIQLDPLERHVSGSRHPDDWFRGLF